MMHTYHMFDQGGPAMTTRYLRSFQTDWSEPMMENPIRTTEKLAKTQGVEITKGYWLSREDETLHSSEIRAMNCSPIVKDPA